MHQAQGGTVGKPHAVADVIHPAVADHLVSGIDALVFHHEQIDVLDVGIVIRKCAVHGLHLADGLVEDEGTFAGFVNELVFVLQAVDIADQLAYPGPGDLILKLGAGYLLLGGGAGKRQQREEQYRENSFHTI